MAYVRKVVVVRLASNTVTANPANLTAAVSSRTERARALVSTMDAPWQRRMNVAAKDIPDSSAAGTEHVAGLVKVLYATRRRLGMTVDPQKGCCIVVEWVRRNVIEAVVTYVARKTKIVEHPSITAEDLIDTIFPRVDLLMSPIYLSSTMCVWTA